MTGSGMEIASYRVPLRSTSRGRDGVLDGYGSFVAVDSIAVLASRSTGAAGHFARS